MNQWLSLGRRVLTLFCVLIGIAACDQAEPGKLRVHAGQYPPFQFLFLAESLGYFAPADIELVELANPSQSLNAFRNHRVDAKTVMLDEALTLLSEGFDIRAMLVLDYSIGPDTMVIGRPGFTSMKDLAGKRVGVEKLTSNAYILARALELNGLAPADVQSVFLAEDEHEQAFRDGKVDAVVAYGPVMTRLLALGGQRLFDTSVMSAELLDILVVHADVAQDRVAEMGVLLDGWYRAQERLASDRDGATAFMARRINATPAEFLETMTQVRLPDRAENRKLLLDKDGLRRTAHRMMETMIQHGFLPGAVDPARLIDPRLVQGLYGQ